MNLKLPITDIFFDLDHTLWDFESNSALALERIFDKHAITIPLQEFLVHFQKHNYAFWDLYRQDQISQHELRIGRLRESFKAFGHYLEVSKLEELSQDYVFWLPQFNQLMEHTIETLEYLQKKYRLHIITNGFEDVQFLKLKNANIAQYFHTVTNSEMAGVKKPNPIIFAYAIQKANTKKETSLMIGDCIASDVRGALQFGMQAIYFNDQKNDFTENWHTIYKLSELLNIL